MKFQSGHLYGQTKDGTVVDVGHIDPSIPLTGLDVLAAVLCRRVADCPGGVAPLGAGVGQCAACRVPIAYNPQRSYTVPRVCLQCAAIQPDPMR